jgi:hypothetical protein
MEFLESPKEEDLLALDVVLIKEELNLLQEEEELPAKSSLC